MGGGDVENKLKVESISKIPKHYNPLIIAILHAKQS